MSLHNWKLGNAEMQRTGFLHVGQEGSTCSLLLHISERHQRVRHALQKVCPQVPVVTGDERVDMQMLHVSPSGGITYSSDVLVGRVGLAHSRSHSHSHTYTHTLTPTPTDTHAHTQQSGLSDGKFMRCKFNTRNRQRKDGLMSVHGSPSEWRGTLHLDFLRQI